MLCEEARGGILGLVQVTRWPGPRTTLQTRHGLPKERKRSPGASQPTEARLRFPSSPTPSSRWTGEMVSSADLAAGRHGRTIDLLERRVGKALEVLDQPTLRRRLFCLWRRRRFGDDRTRRGGGQGRRLRDVRAVRRDEDARLDLGVEAMSRRQQENGMGGDESGPSDGEVDLTTGRVFAAFL